MKKNIRWKKHGANKKNTPNYKRHASVEGIALKKKYGQHFLRWQNIVDAMTAKVSPLNNQHVFEIGCGDGFLTQSILAEPIKKLWVFEIDPEWAAYVRNKFPDKRLEMFQDNFLEISLDRFRDADKWVVLSNLPYNVSFPILFRFIEMRNFLKHGVVMVQEEVAQKIVSTGGRSLGFVSLYLQHFFDWQLLNHVPAQAFVPPPKVSSRLLYFEPRVSESIPHEDLFWKFIRQCFLQPRRTLKNNLMQTAYDWSKIDPEILKLRAQQMNKQLFLELWRQLHGL